MRISDFRADVQKACVELKSATESESNRGLSNHVTAITRRICEERSNIAEVTYMTNGNASVNKGSNPLSSGCKP